MSIHSATSTSAQDGSPTETTTDSTQPAAAPAKPKSRRGFASMDPKLVSEIASKGGKAAHAAGTAHEFTADEARAAGRKGGLAPHTRRKRRASADNPQ